MSNGKNSMTLTLLQKKLIITHKYMKLDKSKTDFLIVKAS
jgi:hypothetical protein